MSPTEAGGSPPASTVFDLEIIDRDGWVVLRLRDGTELGRGRRARVLPRLAEAIRSERPPTTTVAGVAVHAAVPFDGSETELLVGSVDHPRPRLVLFARDPHGRVLARVEVDPPHVRDLLAWLEEPPEAAGVPG